MTLGGAAQVAAAHCPKERTLLILNVKSLNNSRRCGILLQLAINILTVGIGGKGGHLYYSVHVGPLKFNRQFVRPTPDQAEEKSAS